MFAEISDTVWLAIIGVITMGLKEYFDICRAKTTRIKLAAVVETVSVVKDDLTTVKATTADTNKLANGMRDQLVKATGEAERAKGIIEGKAVAALEINKVVEKVANNIIDKTTCKMADKVIEAVKEVVKPCP